MLWQVEWDYRAVKELRKLDKLLQKNIIGYLKERVVSDAHPKRLGKALVPDRRGLWRYRVQNARLICHINEQTKTVLILKVGYRKQVYQ